MAYHYDHHHQGDYRHSDDLVKHLHREIPHHSHRPVQYIVNDGKLIIDEKSLRHSTNNTLIYNRPGSTMWVQPRTSSGHHHHHHSSSSSRVETYQRPSTYWQTSSTHACRGCQSLRSLYGGYCRECIEVKMVRPREPRVDIIRDARRLLSLPDRRLIEYR